MGESMGVRGPWSTPDVQNNPGYIHLERPYLSPCQNAKLFLGGDLKLTRETESLERCAMRLRCMRLCQESEQHDSLGGTVRRCEDSGMVILSWSPIED
jgi:hypothetical protein